jgi:UDP-2,3-diacylglucosamine pyrophosphatase LpxH
MDAKRNVQAGAARRARLSRALFLSDVHLATRSCRAEALLDFLQHNDAETIYLVGDIVDFWRIKRGAVWPQSHSDVLQALLCKMRGGTRLVFVPGNHDEGLRDYCGTRFNGIEIVRDIVHATADGRRLLVTHGDQFDVVVRYAKWLALLGDRGHVIARAINSPLQWTRSRFGLGLWSLSAFLKLKVKTAVNFIGEFEDALVAEARARGLDGVVCGHIHHAAHRDVGGIQYLNCGDWVESYTAIAEDAAGTLHVIDWQKTLRERETERGSALAPRLQEAA